MSKQTLREIYNNGWDEHIEGNNDKGSIHSYIELYQEILEEDYFVMDNDSFSKTFFELDISFGSAPIESLR